MGDGLPIWRLGPRARRVHMDPLVVARDLSEPVDHLLVHDDGFGDDRGFPHEAHERLYGVE